MAQHNTPGGETNTISETSQLLRSNEAPMDVRTAKEQVHRCSFYASPFGASRIRIKHLIFFLPHLLRLPLLKVQSRHREHMLQNLALVARLSLDIVRVGDRGVGSKARECLSNIYISEWPLVAIARVVTHSVASLHETGLSPCTCILWTRTMSAQGTQLTVGRAAEGISLV